MKRLFLSAAALLCAQAWAQNFAVEGAVIDSRNGASLGVVSERGELASLFRAQKAMTFGILRSAGISLEQLSPEVRARIERFQTTNVEAFRAFSQGLDLKDQGRFAEAREQFRRAAELDPNFALAKEQQQSMPDINIGTGMQMRAVLAAAAGNAVDRSKVAVAVDAARAVAALQAGQTLVMAQAQDVVYFDGNRLNYNRTQSQGSAAAQPSFATAFAVEGSGNLITFSAASDFSVSEVQLASGVLQRLGGDDIGFNARLLNARSTGTGSVQLSDGSTAYWGSWNSTPTSTASLLLGSTVHTSPELGNFHWAVGDAMRAMPSSGTVLYTPSGGSLAGMTGTIGVDFTNRVATLNNLGFSIGNLVFSNLTATANFAATSSGFAGLYTGGQCAGCTGFSATTSTFNAAFIGRSGAGLAFSTTMVSGPGTGTGGNAVGTQVLRGP